MGPTNKGEERRSVGVLKERWGRKEDRFVWSKKGKVGPFVRGASLAEGEIVSGFRKRYGERVQGEDEKMLLCRGFVFKRSLRQFLSS